MAMPTFDALCVLLEIGDRPPLDFEEHLVVGRILTEQRLQMAVELTNAGDQRREVVLDLGEHEVHSCGALDAIGAFEQVGEFGESITDRVEDRRLEADRAAQLRVRVHDAADCGLAAPRERPLEVLAFEVFRRRVGRGVVLGRLEELPIRELAERAVEGEVVGRLVPADGGQRTPHLSDVQCRRGDSRILERRHQRRVQLPALGRREPEEVGIDAPPHPLVLHAVNPTQGSRR
jgi:hypothetical protein